MGDELRTSIADNLVWVTLVKLDVLDESLYDYLNIYYYERNKFLYL